MDHAKVVWWEAHAEKSWNRIKKNIVSISKYFNQGPVSQAQDRAYGGPIPIKLGRKYTFPLIGKNNGATESLDCNVQLCNSRTSDRILHLPLTWETNQSWALPSIFSLVICPLPSFAIGTPLLQVLFCSARREGRWLDHGLNCPMNSAPDLI